MAVLMVLMNDYPLLANIMDFQSYQLRIVCGVWLGVTSASLRYVDLTV